MLKINENNQVNAKDIYAFVEVKTRFDMWIKRCINYADLQDKKDFCTVLSKSTGGRPALEYFFTIDAAKEVCIVSATEKAKELRRWLISIANKVENSELVNHKQVIEVIRLVKIFAVYEFRKKATELNLKNFENNFTGNKKYLHSAFHNWRNEILNLGREELEQRVLEYCILEHKAVPNLKKMNKDSLLFFLKQYENIKIAFWDLLSSQNQSEELINNICSLASEIAKEIKPFLNRLNETNLFFDKIPNVKLMLNE